MKRRWPRVILQWEDFSKNNAWRLLQRHKDQLATFNDDIQGTAAVTVAGLLRACRKRVAGRSLKEERVVILGAGSAATGIAALLSEALCQEGVGLEKAREAIWLVGYARAQSTKDVRIGVRKKSVRASRWLISNLLGLEAGEPMDLGAVVRQARPTALIGTSGQPNVFDEPLIRMMAKAVDRPIIFPLSNPTSKSEAVPEDLYRWIGSGRYCGDGQSIPGRFLER